MLIGSICPCSQTNACTKRTANHRAKAPMENASRAPYPPLQKAAPIHPVKKVTHNYQRSPWRAVISRFSIVKCRQQISHGNTVPMRRETATGHKRGHATKQPASAMLSIALSLALVASMCPATALATDDANAQATMNAATAEHPPPTQPAQAKARPTITPKAQQPNLPPNPPKTQ